ncbi:MAG: CpsD/CapB family tyrosine-protein kinase [Nitrospirota bacterium]|nr:CpsD/CapB family tyrosine-protein kinase [Nitrospirota bacterium]
MSKIYDALQIAHGEQLAATKEVSDEPITSSPPPLTGYSQSVLPRFYEESDLLALAQNIAARLPNPDQNVIQFMGSRMGEGTSTLIREFALIAAKHSNKPVLLIEADFNKPSQNQAFGIETKPPLEHVLQEGKPLDGVISQVEESNLFLASLSSKVQRSLTDRSFFGSTDMWKTAREQFSLILIDSSPATVTADSLSLCETVNGIVLVLQAEKTRSAVAREVKRQILMREGNLLGIVFTKRKFYIPKFIYKFL